MTLISITCCIALTQQETAPTAARSRCINMGGSKTFVRKPSKQGFSLSLPTGNWQITATTWLTPAPCGPGFLTALAADHPLGVIH